METRKFAGVGLKNMIVIALFTMMVIVVTKVIVTKHPVNGVTQLVNAV
ncbi:hypothetical protein ACFTRE_22045 [Bacillus subtilis]|nr:MULTISPECIES: hypothetical protein [Bacillus]MBB4876435.1 hypothetical protein [Bacillus velezensis]MBE1281660.1 hypothetical protein [Bacillus sp. Bvel1]MCM3278802.1 hypothetical protein [Bacillus velezensis]MCM3351881.1 hypothetical protein [Bacillus velezensis]MDN4185445.1 hypothetical protein [Bacillus subtilis]